MTYNPHASSPKKSLDISINNHSSTKQLSKQAIITKPYERFQGKYQKIVFNHVIFSIAIFQKHLQLIRINQQKIKNYYFIQQDNHNINLIKQKKNTPLTNKNE